MTIFAAVLACLTIRVTLAAEVVCENPLRCPCGSKEQNVTVCAPATEAEFCTKLSNCEACEDGLSFCSKCPEGFEGPFCSQVSEVSDRKSRQKRQSMGTYLVRSRRPSRPGSSRTHNQFQRVFLPLSSCSNLDSPKLGSIRCVSNEQQQVCTGTCLPGYTFDVQEALEEMSLTCKGGVWTPRTSFPDCISGGYCDLVVRGSGSFNCTTGMDGTRCDVHCYNRLAGRYFCYPGRAWTPALPSCVRPKEVAQDRCRCENGGTCDSFGKCQCPAATTGVFCETTMMACRDPGFISNGVRWNPDGSDSLTRESFLEGQWVVYGCRSEEFSLRGTSLLSCQQDGTWSGSLPKCITHSPEAPSGVTCPDPGQVPNADRLNSDGSPSVGVQQYRVKQSVVYTCHPGFALQRRSLITCLDNGAWSFRTPYCTRMTPPPLPPPMPVIRTTTTARPRQAPTASNQFCRDPGIDSRGSRQPRAPPNHRGFPLGSVLEYSCNQGYELRGNWSLYCVLPGRWSANRPTCEMVVNPIDRHEHRESGQSCTNPGEIPNGRMVHITSVDKRMQDDEIEGNYPVGSQLQFSCVDGYILEGPDTLTCEDTGSWSARTPKCVTANPNDRLYCETPRAILYGRILYFPPGVSRSSFPGRSVDYDIAEYPEGSELQYICDDGYRIQGAGTAVCQSSGFWSQKPPSCDLDCGHSFMKIMHKVINGDDTVYGEWPWVVSISVKEGDEYRFICGGAVLNSHTVVTAAHCLEEARSFTLRFGKHHFKFEDDDPEVLIGKSTRRIFHPDYSNSTFDSDIGLIKFQPRLRFSVRVQPICLPTPESTSRNIMTGEVGYVSGWGDTEKALPAEELKLARLPVITNRACLDSYKRQNITPMINSNMFCAGYADARQTVCSGDSGSPIVFYDRKLERFTLEGLVSFTVKGQCNVPGRYAIFTKVYRFLPWIYNNLK